MNTRTELRERSMSLLPVVVVMFMLSGATSYQLQWVFCVFHTFHESLWHAFIQSAYWRRSGDLQRCLISTASCRNTFKISIFWWWRASEKEVGMREKGGGRQVHGQCEWGREQATEQESERVFARERERETVVMIDARLPPLCSSEWLQQKSTE